MNWPPAEWPATTIIFKIWKEFFACEPAKNFVHEIERAELVACNFCAARAPSVWPLVFTDPIRFIAGQSVATVASFVSGCAAIRREPWCHDDRVIQCVRQESSGKCGTEVIVCVTINAVHKDKCAGDGFVLCL